MGLIREKVWSTDAPTYDRTWVEIESLLEQAVQEMKTQHAKYKLRKLTGQKRTKCEL